MTDFAIVIGYRRHSTFDNERRCTPKPLSEAMLDALRVAFDTASGDRGVRVVVPERMAQLFVPAMT